jgi:hypothetical protein
LNLWSPDGVLGEIRHAIISRDIELVLPSITEMLKNGDIQVQLSSIDCLSQLAQEGQFFLLQIFQTFI